MSKSKKIILLVLGLLIVALSFTGASYAMWQINNSQDGENVVNVGCFETSTDLGTSNENPSINLDKHFPISDDEGMNLTPFTFTISNTCTTIATYQLNLETLSSSNIGKQYIKVAVNNNISNLNILNSVEKTLSSATSSNMLESGTLYPGQSITFNIRLWLDEATTVEDIGADEQGTNLVYAAKVTLTTSPRLYNDSAVDTLMKLVSGADTTSTDVIEATTDAESCTNTFAYDGTIDNNLRYVGANPCNYVSYNNELWRVIGVMNNIDDGTGKKETRLKLIRNDSLGNYSWDSSAATTNRGRGINQWGESGEYLGADLMQELNGDYLNLSLTENTTWYNDGQNKKEAVFDYTKRLNENAQGLISNAVWYTGAINDTNINDNTDLTSVVYQNERGNNLNATNNGKYCPNSHSECNDEITRTYKWAGKVALIYPSDFGYAVGGAVRNICLSTSIYKYKNNNCNINDWLNNSTRQFFLSPYAFSYGATFVSALYVDGYIINTYTCDGYNYTIRPSIYLKSSVKITSGSGTIDSPYTLSN